MKESKNYTLEQWKIYLSKLENQTPEKYLEAVKKDGWALEYVKEQTYEICFEAIKYNGFSLEYIQSGILDSNKHFVFENENARKVYVNKINGKWLFSIGCQNNITKEEFIDRIHNDNGGLSRNPHRQI